MLKIYEDSINYTCQVIKLPNKVEVPGLNNLCKVSIFGNDCLIGADSDPEGLYLFFPAECKIDSEFLSANNLYINSELNRDKTKKGFFEDNGRVKALKFKGIICTGFICPISFLSFLSDNKISYRGGFLDLSNNGGFETKSFTIKVNDSVVSLVAGDEFNSIANINICSKYYNKLPEVPQTKKDRKIIDFIDDIMAPQHFDTEHLLKNCHRLKLDDYIAVTYKLHGTSARYFNTLVKRKLSLLERVCQFFGVKVQTEEYKVICGSRKALKSMNFETFEGKNHYYSEDLWSKVGKEYFEGKLNHGEAVYAEVIGRDYTGAAIQHGYTYRLDKPKVYIYRISNINSQGIEVDLSYSQMKERAIQLGLDICPEYFYGKLVDFIGKHISFPERTSLEYGLETVLNKIFFENGYKTPLLEQPSILDSSVVEEGFCIRIDKYPKPNIYKIKSKLFLSYETGQKDKEITNIEDDQST